MLTGKTAVSSYTKTNYDYSFVDRDMLMRYHKDMGVGHIYSRLSHIQDDERDADMDGNDFIGPTEKGDLEDSDEPEGSGSEEHLNTGDVNDEHANDDTDSSNTDSDSDEDTPDEDDELALEYDEMYGSASWDDDYQD